MIDILLIILLIPSILVNLYVLWLYKILPKTDRYTFLSFENYYDTSFGGRCKSFSLSYFDSVKCKAIGKNHYGYGFITEQQARDMIDRMNGKSIVKQVCQFHQIGKTHQKLKVSGK